MDNNNLLRNVYKMIFQEEKALNTFFNMKNNIKNAISKNNNELINNSVQEFYNSLFGNNFNNFKTILLKGTLEELKLILEILNKEQVKKYIAIDEITEELRDSPFLLYDVGNKYHNAMNIIKEINNEIEGITKEKTILQKSILNIVKECLKTRLNTALLHKK